MINAFIIVAMTADGKIARNAGHAATWTSKEDKKFFVERTKQAGLVIMGKTTYETIGRPMSGRTTIVYSKTEIVGVETTSKAPAELLADLEKRGFKEAAICGGSTIYTMFMKAGLVDTVYITVEPVIFGEGMGIFNAELDVKLELASFKNLNNNVVLLEYRVER